jgi:hypothetical protein
MDYSYMSSTKVVFTVCIVYQTIYRINHLFQNGRALLKCRLFILLQMVIPTLKSHAVTRHVTTRTCHCEQTFQDGPRIFCPRCWLRSSFVLSVLLLSYTPATVFAISPRIAPHFRIFFRENSTGFEVFNTTVRFVLSLLCCCRVTLQPQFRQFFSESFLIFVVFRYLRSLRVVSAVLLLSLTPATVTFVSRNFFVRFVWSVLCC